MSLAQVAHAGRPLRAADVILSAGVAHLPKLLSEAHPDMARVKAYLDGLDPRARLAEARSLGRRLQRRLFEAARGASPITVDHLVPPSTGPMAEVVHHGKNSLGVFTEFAKVFVRGDEATRELWGYNRNSPLVEAVVGPGYFVAYSHRVAGEVLIDYTRLPPKRPEGWPEIVSNAARGSLFVYEGTQDVLRGVSSHVSVGRVTKAGKELPAWFVLCREER